MNLSRIFHCSVINVLCFAVVQQLLYLITEPSACQQLFYFSFFAAVQQLLYLTRSKALCQQLFKIVFLLSFEEHLCLASQLDYIIMSANHCQ